MKHHHGMQFDQLISRLLTMGFTDLPNSPETDAHVLEYFKTHRYLRSFEPPGNLRRAIKWLNTGGSSLNDYSITVGEWPADGSSKEWGEHDDGQGGSHSFGAMEPNEELLAALALGAEGFTKWFNSRSAFCFETKDADAGETVSQGVATVDGEAHMGTGSVN